MAARQHYYDAVYHHDYARLRAILAEAESEEDIQHALGSFVAAIQHDIDEAVEIFLEFGGLFQAQDLNGYTALTWASRKGNTNLVEKMIQAGANVNHPDGQGMTPLLHAALHQHFDTVRLLLQHDADVEHRNIEGHTALQLARLHPFGLPAIPLVGPGMGAVKLPWSSRTARLLARHVK